MSDEVFPILDLPSELVETIAISAGPLERTILSRTSKKFAEMLQSHVIQKRDVCQYAVIAGKLRVVKWAYENGCILDKECMLEATACGSIEILEWLYYKHCPRNTNEIIEAASSIGHLDVLKWFKKNIFIESDDEWREVIVNAAYRGNINILEWVLLNSRNMDSVDYTGSATTGGQLETLVWLRENGCPWTEEVCSEAAWYGNLDILKYARENDCPWNVDVYWGASIDNRVDIIDWAWKNGCPPYESLCYDAAIEERLPIIQWACENGYPMDNQVYHVAVNMNYTEIVEYLRNNGFPK